jgi:hypothetical protein
MWMLNPLHEVRRSVGKFSGNVVPVPNAIERRANQTSRPGHAGNRMTSVASYLRISALPGDSVSSACKFADITDFLLRKAIAAERQCEHNRSREPKRQPHLLPPCESRVSSAICVYCHLTCDWLSHLTSSHKPTAINSVPAGIHIMRPPNCWSSRAVKCQSGAVATYGEYHGRGAKVNRAPGMLVCSACLDHAAARRIRA